MKNIDFNIRVVNKQKIDDSVDEIKEEAIGKYSIKNGKIYILYKTTEDNVENTTIITVERDIVTVKRSGNVSSVMILDRKKKTEFKYNTMYGIIDVIIDTAKIVNALDEHGGKLRLVYSLTMQGAKVYNDMEVAVWRNIDENI